MEIVCFFRKNAHVETFFFFFEKQIICVWYTTICPPEVYSKIRKMNSHRFNVKVYFDQRQKSVFKNGIIFKSECCEKLMAQFSQKNFPEILKKDYEKVR